MSPVARHDRGMRWLMPAQFMALTTLVLFVIWWGKLLLAKAERIVELEQLAGLSTPETLAQLESTRRMIFWEMPSFLLVLLALSILVSWIFWRDLKRARSIRTFFAATTHELRTPLTSIRLQAEAIADATPVASPLTRLTLRLLEDTTRLENQVNRTLELARLEGGGRIDTRAVSLRPWMDHFLKSWNDHNQRSLQLDSKLDESEIEADPSALELVFRNLLENSLRHSRRNSPHIEMRSEHKNGWTVLKFKDDGEGFEGNPRILGRIFERGSRSQGAGVGLYLVQSLMTAMGGRAVYGTATPHGFEVSLWFKDGNLSHG